MESFDNNPSKLRFTTTTTTTTTATSPLRKPGFPKVKLVRFRSPRFSIFVCLLQRITLPSSTYDSQHAITDTTTINPSHVFLQDEISKESTFDYLYEFSETRKVLEDFFNEPTIDPMLNDSDSVSSTAFSCSFSSPFHIPIHCRNVIRVPTMLTLASGWRIYQTINTR